ncbi:MULTISPECIES: tetratricopeptide repeat protein [unclassified Leifsonia]|uniref:tetratricopeptide repeat protein n=1 Tax=unclassified Leifsonia TaxID=2663824 RepID=UPI001442C00B|nr:tetratricopeptide repeat protein [Leifsonia sp. PS1209]QIZ98567.1 tetratricopeptide repeat protein [Leifsonia sp. PS1209]
MSQIPPSPTNLRGAVDLTSLVNRAMTSGQPAAAGAAAGTAPAGEQGGDVALPSLYFEGTDANFNDFLDLSMTVPVVVDLWAEWCEPCKQLSPILDRLIAEYGGRLVLVKVDVDANPQLTQAFQAQSIPAVAAVIGGRPVQLFAGAIPEQQVRDVFEQLLQLAAQNGVTGRAAVDGAAVPEAGDAAEQAEPTPEPLPPHHAEAYEAIERGDFDTAIAEYKTAIAQDPRDSMAVAGLAQVSLLARLAGKSLDEIRSAGAAAPDDVDAQLLVADLDISGGHVDDAFDRLLTLFPKLDAAGKDAVRTRILDYFEIVGVDDQRVVKARARLASLLY